LGKQIFFRRRFGVDVALISIDIALGRRDIAIVL
jgi:hypothetical protein